MLGFSKPFVIVLAIASIIGFGTHNIQNFIVIMGMYIIIKVIWNILT